MTTLELTNAQVAHVRRLLFEDLQQMAGRLVKKTQEAREALRGPEGEDAEGMWQACGANGSAAILDMIGWSTWATDDVSGNDAAWAHVAEAADRALSFSGTSDEVAERMRDLRAAARVAAGAATC